MKKLIVILSVLLASITIYAEKAQVGATVRLRNTTTMNEDNKMTANYFSVERGYVTLKYNFTKRIKTNFTIDFVSSSKEISYLKGAELDTAGNLTTSKGELNLVKDGTSPRIKKATITFLNDINNIPLNINFGVIGNIAYVDHPSTFINYAGISERYMGISSAVMGASIGSNFLDKKVGISLQIASSSYKGIAHGKSTLYPELSQSLTISPIKGLKILLLNTYMIQETTNSDGTKENDGYSDFFSPAVKYDNDYVEFSSEYAIKANSYSKDSTTAMGFYVQPGLKLKKVANIPVTIGGGFGYYKPNKDEDVVNKVILAGIKIDLIKNVKLQTAYLKEINDETTKTNALMVQIEYKFSKDIE